MMHTVRLPAEFTFLEFMINYGPKAYFDAMHITERSADRLALAVLNRCIITVSVVRTHFDLT